MRFVSWFSAGAASAVATKLMLKDHPDLIVAYADTGSEHPDNKRFIAECEEWFGVPIRILKNPQFGDIYDVFRKRKFIVSVNGAPCTAELKKKVRFQFERPDDVQVFGFTVEERDRAHRFEQQNPGVHAVFPLIDRRVTKSDCLAILDNAGIQLPIMYRLGYRNNNCIGCVKGGMGYWNKIRVDFPEVFEKMARLERELGHAILKDKNGPVFLDELAPDRGNPLTEPDIECGVICQIVSNEISSG